MTACPDFETLSALHDGERQPVARAHVESCPKCRELLERLSQLGASLRALPDAQRRAPPVRLRPRARRLGWLAAPLAAAAVALVWLSGHHAIPRALTDEVISQHLRAFANGHACEVRSGNAADVARFLSERLGRPVSIPKSLRASLVGARRCSLFGERAGAVVYRENGVAVTVFLPKPGGLAARESAGAIGRCAQGRDGQTVCVLPGADGPRLAVGELSAAELGRLVASR